MVQQDILEAVADENMKVYVVWTPVLQEDNRQAAAEMMRLIPDSRAVHFWDEDKSLGFLLGTTVTLPRGRDLAWDVYFAFDATAKWGDVPPQPANWMHQLGLDERTLDGDTLRAAVVKLLEPSSETISPPRRLRFIPQKPFEHVF